MPYNASIICNSYLLMLLLLRLLLLFEARHCAWFSLVAWLFFDYGLVLENLRQSWPFSIALVLFICSCVSKSTLCMCVFHFFFHIFVSCVQCLIYKRLWLSNLHLTHTAAKKRTQLNLHESIVHRRYGWNNCSLAYSVQFCFVFWLRCTHNSRSKKWSSVKTIRESASTFFRYPISPKEFRVFWWIKFVECTFDEANKSSLFSSNKTVQLNLQFKYNSFKCFLICHTNVNSYQFKFNY